MKRLILLFILLPVMGYSQVIGSAKTGLIISAELEKVDESYILTFNTPRKGEQMLLLDSAQVDKLFNATQESISNKSDKKTILGKTIVNIEYVMNQVRYTIKDEETYFTCWINKKQIKQLFNRT